MTATGCTYGKSNIEKLYYNKLAFTLIDNKAGRSVRVSLTPEFFEKALASPFVQQRKAGIPPQDIDPSITDPLIKRILGLNDEEFLVIGPIVTQTIKKAKGLLQQNVAPNVVNSPSLARCGKPNTVAWSAFPVPGMKDIEWVNYMDVIEIKASKQGS